MAFTSSYTEGLIQQSEYHYGTPDMSFQDVDITGSLTISGSLLNTGNSTKTDSGSPHTLSTTEHLVLIDASGGAVTINLPDSATYPGRQIYFKVTTDPSGNTITLQRQGSDNIDGATTSTALDTQYEAISVISDGGGNWYIF